MSRQLELTISALALLTTIVTGTVVVESRFAKASDVRHQISEYYAKSLKLRLLEIQLKPAPLNPADRALLEYLQQELREITPAAR